MAEAGGGRRWTGLGRARVGWAAAVVVWLVFVVAFACLAPVAVARTVFVSNANSGDVSALAIGADGGLSAVANSPFTAGAFFLGVAVTPDARRVYVPHAAAGDGSGFA